MSDALSLEDFAQRTGEPLDELKRWHEAGLFATAGAPPAELERLRLVGALRRHGIDLDTIAAALRDHSDVVEDFTRRLTTATPAPDSSANELASAVLPADVIDRIVEAGNLEEALQAPTLDDVAASQTIRMVVESGFPVDALLQLIRVYSDAMDRIADAETRLFHIHVHQALRDSGLSEPEAAAIRDSISDQLEAVIEPTLVYFHRKSWQRALRHDFVIHMLEKEIKKVLPPDEDAPSKELVKKRLQGLGYIE